MGLERAPQRRWRRAFWFLVKNAREDSDWFLDQLIVAWEAESCKNMETHPSTSQLEWRMEHFPGARQGKCWTDRTSLLFPCHKYHLGACRKCRTSGPTTVLWNRSPGDMHTLKREEFCSTASNASTVSPPALSSWHCHISRKGRLRLSHELQSRRHVSDCPGVCLCRRVTYECY